MAAVGLAVRFGPSADILAVFIPFALLPFSAVYYPIAAFPSVLQSSTFILPTRHIFGGMRTAMTEGVIPHDGVIWATTLNIIYSILAFPFLHGMLRLARSRGYLSRLVQDWTSTAFFGRNGIRRQDEAFAKRLKYRALWGIIAT